MWGTPLYAAVDGTVDTNIVSIEMTHNLEKSSVLTLQNNLNDEIKKANERRKADTTTTKVDLKKMVDNVNRCMDFYDQLFQSFHKGQLLLEENLKN